jgi:hypothetical protein
MGILADQLTRRDSSHSLVGLEPALGKSAKVAREVIRGWMSKKLRSVVSPFMDKIRLRAFLNDLLLKTKLENCQVETRYE